MKTEEDPILAKYSEVQRKIIPSLADVAPCNDPGTWCPKALDPIKADGCILYYSLVHVKAPTIRDPDYIILVYPKTKVVGMDQCGVLAENSRGKETGIGPFYSYYALRNCECGKKKVVKWVGSSQKFVAKMISVDGGADCEWLVKCVAEMHTS